MDLSVKQQLLDIPDLRRRLRQLRWFTRAFRSHAQAAGRHVGIDFEVHERRLSQAFFAWVKAIAPVEHDPRLDKADRIVFLGGLALRELLRSHPASAGGERRPAAADPTEQIAHFWPEGFLYTNFCICSIAAVHEQEFGTPRRLDDIASDLRTWWSYRENATEDPNLSIAFLDSFLGETPNWMFPSMARARTGHRVLAGEESATGRLSRE